MGTEIGIIKNTGRYNGQLDLTEFFGGEEKGLMLQLTQANRGHDFIQLTRHDIMRLIPRLLKWYVSTEIKKGRGGVKGTIKLKKPIN